MDTQPLLQEIRERRGALEALIAQFTTQQTDNPHPPDGWSVKDVMAHVAFWENYAAQRLQEAARGETPKMLGDVDEARLNQINADALQAGRAQSLEQVQADFARVHRELIDAIQTVPQDPNAVWWALWPDAETPRNLIEWNTTGHYDEHGADLQKWLEAKP